MTRKELFAEIPNILTGFYAIVDEDRKWFTITVKGCVFPDELIHLRKLCYVSHIGFSVYDLVFEISCTDY